MNIIAVNVGVEKEVHWKGKLIQTGIFKYAVDEPIFLDVEHVKNDVICDRKHHGGVDQAVYGYSLNHYQYWREIYPNVDWQYGMFGENLTIDGLDEAKLHVGDRFQVGAAILEVTKPRLPCLKLGLRFNDMKIVKKFWNSSFSGVYFKVLQTGLVRTDDVFIPLKLCKENPTIAEVYQEKRKGKGGS